MIAVGTVPLEDAPCIHEQLTAIGLGMSDKVVPMVRVTEDEESVDAVRG
jgi:hypothetical protein